SCVYTLSGIPACPDAGVSVCMCVCVCMYGCVCVCVCVFVYHKLFDDFLLVLMLQYLDEGSDSRPGVASCLRGTDYGKSGELLLGHDGATCNTHTHTHNKLYCIIFLKLYS